jgi:hypothetical protein
MERIRRGNLQLFERVLRTFETSPQIAKEHRDHIARELRPRT